MRKRYPNNKSVSRGAAFRVEPLPWRHRFLIIICAVILAAGFFLAARQHFMSMELGIINSNMRKQLDNLEAEKRRLLLAREVAYSPNEITRAAIKIGFRAVSTEPTGPEVTEVGINPPSETRTDITRVVSERPIKPALNAISEPEKLGRIRESDRRMAVDKQRGGGGLVEKTAVPSRTASAGLLKLR